jgi:hypothetical protein
MLMTQSRRSASTRSCAIWSVLPVVKMRTPDGGRLRIGPIEKLSPGSACEGSGPAYASRRDDVVFDFFIRVRHAAA